MLRCMLSPPPPSPPFGRSEGGARVVPVRRTRDFPVRQNVPRLPSNHPQYDRFTGPAGNSTRLKESPSRSESESVFSAHQQHEVVFFMAHADGDAMVTSANYRLPAYEGVNQLSRDSCMISTGRLISSCIADSSSDVRRRTTTTHWHNVSCVFDVLFRKATGLDHLITECYKSAAEPLPTISG